MAPTNSAAPSRLDALFGHPTGAVLLAIFCNLIWGSAFPFIKFGYRVFQIDGSDTASILCFAGVRFMLGSLLVYLGSFLLQGHRPILPRGQLLAESCALGLWQTFIHYSLYYSAVAHLVGAFGGILNSTQSFFGVLMAHLLYPTDRLTPAKSLGCLVGFGGVLLATVGNHGSGSLPSILFMLTAATIFASSGPWNKSLTGRADGLAVSFLNLFVGGAALFLTGTALGGRLSPAHPLALPVLFYLAFVSGAGYVLWALLMKNNPVSRISVFSLLIPVVNVLLSALLNGEPLFEPQYLAALVLVCSGIYLVNKPRKQAKS